MKKPVKVGRKSKILEESTTQRTDTTMGADKTTSSNKGAEAEQPVETSGDRPATEWTRQHVTAEELLAAQKERSGGSLSRKRRTRGVSK